MLARSLTFRAIAPPSVSYRFVRGYTDAPPSGEKPAEGDTAEASKAAGDTAGEKVAELEAKIKDLNVRQPHSITDRKKEMAYMRADYQTLARRSTEEKAKASDFAITNFARSLLDTTDVLDKALASVPHPVDPSTPLGAFYSGVQLTQRALLQTLEQNKIKPMESLVGSVFDPNRHEATFQVPPDVAPKKADGSQLQPGEIIEVGKNGWTIKDRVLRPAQVGVVQME